MVRLLELQIMPITGSDILVFVEDPGAANFVAELPRIMRQRGRKVHLATSGVATDYLVRRGVRVDFLPDDINLETFVTRLAPSLAVVGTAENPDAYGLRLIGIARSRGIPTIGVVDACTYLERRFRGYSINPLEFCPDTVIVPDNASKDGLLGLGLSIDRIIVAGHPHWDHVRTTARALHACDRAALRQKCFRGLTPDRKVLVFAAELSDGMEPFHFQHSPGYTLVGESKGGGRTEIVIEELLRAVKPMRRNLYLVLRLHPKNLREDFAKYHSYFDVVSSTEPSLEILHAADAVVGMSSMIMIEAVLLNRPTLAVLPSLDQVKWLPTIAAGITPVATTRRAVAEQIDHLLTQVQPANAHLLDNLFPPGASERVADELEKLL